MRYIILSLVLLAVASVCAADYPLPCLTLTGRVFAYTGMNATTWPILAWADERDTSHDVRQQFYAESTPPYGSDQTTVFGLLRYPAVNQWIGVKRRFLGSVIDRFEFAITPVQDWPYSSRFSIQLWYWSIEGKPDALRWVSNGPWTTAKSYEIEVPWVYPGLWGYEFRFASMNVPEVPEPETGWALGVMFVAFMPWLGMRKPGPLS